MALLFPFSTERRRSTRPTREVVHNDISYRSNSFLIESASQHKCKDVLNAITLRAANGVCSNCDSSSIIRFYAAAKCHSTLVLCPDIVNTPGNNG
jgi:hypothetical protein